MPDTLRNSTHSFNKNDEIAMGPDPSEQLSALSEEVEKKKVQDVHKFITTFPDEFPGVGNIEPVPVEGAKKCVIMLGKYHRALEFEATVSTFPKEIQLKLEPVLTELNQIIKNSNSENKATIAAFIKKYGITTIYLEGETPTSIKNLVNEIKEYKKLVKENKDKTEIKIQKEALTYTLGGAFDLVMDGSLSVAPAESDEAQKRAIGPIDPAVIEFRENSLLSLAAASNETFILTNWGESHTLLDGTLKKWNQKNPNNKIATLHLHSATEKKIGDFKAHMKKILLKALEK